MINKNFRVTYIVLILLTTMMAIVGIGLLLMFPDLVSNYGCNSEEHYCVQYTDSGWS